MLPSLTERVLLPSKREHFLLVYKSVIGMSLVKNRKAELMKIWHAFQGKVLFQIQLPRFAENFHEKATEMGDKKSFLTLMETDTCTVVLPKGTGQDSV